MKTTSTEQSVNRIQSTQAFQILAILETAGLDFMVERTPDGWRVETEQRGAVEGYSCKGATLADALGQVTQVLASLELERDPDQPIPYVVDQPVEFCQRFEFSYRDHLASELGEDFLAMSAE
jgi:hypothetical protein